MSNYTYLLVIFGLMFIVAGILILSRGGITG